MDIPITSSLKIDRNTLDTAALLVDLKTLSGHTNATVVRTIDLTPQVLVQLLKELPKNATIYPQLEQLAKELKSRPSDIQQTLAKIMLPAAGGLSATRTSWVLTPEPISTGAKILVSINNQSYKIQSGNIQSNSLQSNNPLSNNVQSDSKQQTILDTSNRALPTIQPKGSEAGQTNTKFDPLSQAQNSTLQAALRTYLPASTENKRFAEQLFKPLLNQTLKPLANSNSKPAPEQTVTLRRTSDKPTAHITQTPIQKNTVAAASTVALPLNDQDSPPLLLSLVKTLNQWRSSTPSVEALTQNNIVGAIKNSGLFLENSLRLHTEPANHAERPTDSRESNALLLSDYKSVVLHLLNAVRTIISQPDGAKTSGALAEGLLQIFAQISGANIASKTLPAEQQLRLLKEFERQVIAQIANITTKQIQTVQHHQSETFSTLLNTDLAFRLSDHLIPIQLKMEYKKQAEKDKPKAKAKREWRFSLEWGFPDCGQFNAEINYIDERLRYRLWVENKHTREHMLEKIHTLTEKLEEKNITLDRCQFVDKPFINNHHKTKMANTMFETRLIDERT